MEQLLTESNVKIQSLKSKILETVGESGQVIIEVIPELERIIGQQPPAQKLLGTAAQNRFNLLFQKFVQIFTTQEHPLVMFLDDLQWADSASLQLMQLLMSESARGYLLLIGAYRDNEVSATHPLMLSLAEIRKASTQINTITLASLSHSSLNQLVADTLSCSSEIAEPLTQLVYQKTQANPFFSTQFLKAIYEDGFITFDWNDGNWQCDIAMVKVLSLSEDILEFMVLQLQKLPAETQSILKLAACIGNQFDLQTLAIVLQKSQRETATGLWKALQSGLILPTHEIYKFYLGHSTQEVEQNSPIVYYKFLHDRVQQAAYSLIPEDQKQATHLKIGRLLQQNLSEIENVEKLFDIVGHLNLGIELMTQAQEWEALAQLNLAAGQKAKNSTAYSAAIRFVQTGIELLAANCWQTQYELTLNLYVTAAETAYLNADFEGMEEIADRVLRSAQTILDKVKIYEIQISALTAQSQMLEAIAVGRNALAQLGVEFSSEPQEALTDIALQTVTEQLQSKQIEELVNLPVMSDPHSIAAMQLLAMLFLPIFMGNPALLPLLGCTMVSRSLQFGNAPASSIGYAIYGMVLSSFLREVERGYCFGRVALNLLERFNVREFKSLTLLLFCACLQHRQEALRATIPTGQEGYLVGMETGDFLYAGYNIINYFEDNFSAGVYLDDWEPEIENYCVVLAVVKQDSPLAYLKMKQQMVQNWRQIVNQPDLFIGTAYDETVMIPKHHQDNELTALAFVYIYKLMLAYFFGNYTNALDYIAQANRYLMAMAGKIENPVFHFYAGLTYLALCSTESEIEQVNTLALVETHQTTLAQWAYYAPMNHQHKVDLVEAEKCRVLSKNNRAGYWYDRAISGAKANEYIQEAALANELAAKFYLERNQEKVASGYMQEAYYCYARWGAFAKTEDLEKRYPQLLQLILQQQRLNLDPLETIATIIRTSTSSSTRTSSSSISDLLDFTSILKAAQSISGSIELDELIVNLSRIILENSGAKKSVLILPQEDTWQVKAITLMNQESIQTDIKTILNSQLLDACQDIPKKLINYVKNTQETVSIDNCQTNIPGIIGEYMLEHQPKSILCTPITNQGHLVGILYLENKLTTGVFTNERLQVINLLSAQAAISLENARLYQKAQQALQDLQQAQLQIVQSEKMSALGNLVAGVAHEMNNPLGFIAATLQQVKPTVAELTEHLKLYQETIPNPSAEIVAHSEEIDLDYSLEDLPKMINAMAIACDRLKNMSTSLRTFSRADKEYKVPFNIHDGIDSTLLILKHRLKANEERPAIEVITNYSNLPQVDSFPGQLNQVFMNILANAIEALEESNSGRSFTEIEAHPNRITVKTFQEDNQAKILIVDNGKGMSAEVKQKIFDYLFTTKGVGKGTGLGLAIARQIVEEIHAGKLSCNSILGHGTEFLIEIPIRA